MILNETKLFSEVEVGTYLAIGGHVVQKISDVEVQTIVSHIWTPENGRRVIRKYAGNIRKANPKHYVYVGDIQPFLPYMRIV